MSRAYKFHEDQTVNVRVVLYSAAYTAASLLLALFGQYLIGPPNIHSARALVMLVETVGIVFWLLSNPKAFLVSVSPPFRIGAGLMLLAGFISVPLAAHNWAAALVGQLEWIAHFLVLVACVDLLARGKLSIEGVMVGLIVAGFVAIMFYTTRWNLMDAPREFQWLWGAEPFLHMRHFAFLTLPAFIAAFYFVINGRALAQKLGVVAMTLLMASLFWAGGRASIGAAVLAILIGLIFAIRLRRVSCRKILVQILIVVVAAAILSELFAVDHNGMGLSINHGREQVQSVDKLSSGRLSIWKSVIDTMSWEQWLYGQGVDNYRYLPGRFDETAHPHSWAFQALSAWGMPVATFLVGGLWLLVGRLLVSFLKDGEGATFSRQLPFSTLVVFSYLVLSLVDGNFYHAWGVFLILPFIASCFVGFYQIEDDSRAANNKKMSSGWLYAVGFVVVSVVIQLMNVSTVFDSKVPEPGSWRAQLVMAVPYNAVFVGNWLGAWQDYDQVAMLGLLRWMQSNSADGYRYMLLESEMLLEAGHEQAAENLYDKAIDHAPARAKKALIEESAFEQD